MSATGRGRGRGGRKGRAGPVPLPPLLPSGHPCCVWSHPMCTVPCPLVPLQRSRPVRWCCAVCLVHSTQHNTHFVPSLATNMLARTVLSALAQVRYGRHALQCTRNFSAPEGVLAMSHYSISHNTNSHTNISTFFTHVRTYHMYTHTHTHKQTNKLRLILSRARE